ncbi:MAG: hypothetical protein A3F90_01385 [Deltaproteobacteria bacterium RIFCSPLOWO2_12_FULL_60_19]|nr:MAG: hypothetical protein A3F90_01385 [Deltaproteobacteria bacterium RIFCSPLOWO2_12_FULL_60_19]
MTFAKTTPKLSIALFILSLCVSTTLALPLSKQDGDQLQRKIEEIAKNGSAVPVQARRTPVSENEVNSYLAFNAKDNIPRGLIDPQISIVGNGALAGRALVDLDEFKRHRNSQGFMDPLNYLSGKVPITARGVLRTRDGKGQFQFGSATILGVPLPKPVLQELVTFFTRTPEQPKGFNLDAPFDLPAKIREVVIGNAEAVVMQ